MGEIWFEEGKTKTTVGYETIGGMTFRGKFYIWDSILLSHLPTQPTKFENRSPLELFHEALGKLVVKENDAINLIHPSHHIRNYVKWRRQGIFKEDKLFDDLYCVANYNYSFIEQLLKENDLDSLRKYGYLKDEK